jgi:hypothetical protein
MPRPVDSTSVVWRCREFLEQHFQPGDIINLTVPEIREQLKGKGRDAYERSTILRALLRKRD